MTKNRKASIILEVLVNGEARFFDGGVYWVLDQGGSTPGWWRVGVIVGGERYISLGFESADEALGTMHLYYRGLPPWGCISG